MTSWFFVTIDVGKSLTPLGDSITQNNDNVSLIELQEETSEKL